MLDKNLVKLKFLKSIPTYDDNAVIQSKMAKKLAGLIEGKKYDNILEIGSYTGSLTKNIISKFEFENYLALDIVDSFSYIKNLSSKIKFLKTDIEEFETSEKFDIIISNATLQWCENLQNVIKKLKSILTTGGLIAFSIFDNENLFEIKDIFNVGLNYKTLDEIKKIAAAAGFKNFNFLKEKHTMKFNAPAEVLKHLKLTGVNSLSKTKLSYKEIKQKMDLLDKKYNNKITYSALYIILS